MNIIIYIIKKIIIKKAKKLPFKKREKILNFLYYIQSFKNLTIFNNEILNKFIYKEKKLSLQNLYYKAKFIYFTLTRFIYLYKKTALTPGYVRIIPNIDFAAGSLFLIDSKNSFIVYI